jgi:hypothetical protein
MTDALTDAVRRIKQLQNDVERLKSAENEEGEPRLIFRAQEQAVADETVKIGPDEEQSETATATDQQADLQKQREVGANINHGQFTTSTYNTTTYNGAVTRPEAVDYDLSSSGTVVSLRDVGATTAFGFTLKATSPATFVVESVPETTGPFRLATFPNTTTISSGFDAPEATAIRLRNVTAASGTADAIANARATLQAGQRGKSTAIPKITVARRRENTGYDLNDRDIIVSLPDITDATTIGFTIDATVPATFAVELIGDTRGVFETLRFQNTSSVTSGLEAPEADAVRIRNTTTAAGSVDALLDVN